jgi:hypothetical protein
MVNWEIASDYLCCNPMFHNHARHDCVLVKVSGGFGQPPKYMFAQLCFIFKCTVNATQYSMALIHPYDALPGTINQQRDREFRFHKLKAKPRASSEFILVESIVRGALVVEDYGTEGHFLVVDVVDADMWFRVKGMRS